MEPEPSGRIPTSMSTRRTKSNSRKKKEIEFPKNLTSSTKTIRFGREKERDNSIEITGYSPVIFTYCFNFDRIPRLMIVITVVANFVIE